MKKLYFLISVFFDLKIYSINVCKDGIGTETLHEINPLLQKA